MVDSVTSKSSLLDSLNAGQVAETTKARKTEDLGQNEFLQLLVTQLKTQDPLDPMKNEEFAVNLAQFSQLEQLVGINQKIGQGSADSISSLTGYLGHYVMFDGNQVDVKGGSAGAVQVNLDDDAESVAVDFVDEFGGVVGTKDLGAFSAGKHIVDLDNLSLPTGSYGVKVRASDASHRSVGSTFSLAGLVSGLVPGDDPMLLVGSREIRPVEVREVGLPPE